MRLRLALAAVLVLGANAARAQSIQAVRLEAAAPRIDGRLTERVWATAPAIASFLQREPDEGSPAIDSTEVRFAYDDDALYVGARMFSKNPGSISTHVTRRDNEGSSERIAVSFDTYRDRRTAYTFEVTTAGVRLDSYHPSDDEDDENEGYDPVWSAAAQVDSLGWTAEMRIPFTQLRFSPGEHQEWGVNVARMVPERQEESYWRLVRRSETGWSSRMGTLTGLRGIRPSRRVEAIPYVAANSRFTRIEDQADPFESKTQGYARGGGDLKMGLGPNLTLDVTLNPDFGQVEADPANVNLTAYEVFFDERRPFFSEGASLLDRRGLFYSRRIGAPPPGDANADFAEERDNTTILGAAKLTGRLPSGLSVAALAAVTDQERVRTFDETTQLFGRAVVAPRTAYAAASAQQEFGEDASTLMGMVTAVHRDVDAGTPLGDLLPRTAFSGLTEGRYRWAGGKFDVNSWLGVTRVSGDSGAILRQQFSSRRYWQRVDRFRVDSSLRDLSGVTFGLGHSKLAGKHWLWDVDYVFETPGFEPNDMGAFGAVDNRRFSSHVTWRETQPAAWYRRWDVGVSKEDVWNFDGLHRGDESAVFFSTTFRNFWSFSADVTYQAPALSDRLTRGGPIMGTPSARGWSAELQSRDDAPIEWNVDVGGGVDAVGSWENSAELGLNWRPGDRWEVSLEPEWTRARDRRQYITEEPNGRPETFDTRYVFAAVDLSEISAQFRLNYNFTPNLTLETYAEPFAASGRFYSFGELLAPRSRDLLLYGTNGTTIVRNADGSHTVTAGGQSFDIDNEDFNETSFRSNMVLRWEWRPGSTLFLVWQQDRSTQRQIGVARPRDLLRSLRASGDNFLAIKLSYWTALK